jgi:uncharacterized OB-fold protein
MARGGAGVMGGTEALPPGPEAQFWAHLRGGRLMIQRSRSTGAWVFYPRLVAPVSGAMDLEFCEVSGLGTVYSTTTLRRPAKHGGDHNVSVVTLDEGVRMLGRVLGLAPDAVRIGMRVRVAIETVDFGLHAGTDQPIVVFRPVAGEAVP